ncbi:MAG: transcriptional regulator [Saprospiraceae bacterium]|nr:transcriptional regulator [Saprospiraceae bacterium]
MNFKEGKEKFLQTWGTLASSWGINKTMAQVHALLLIAPRSLCADEIMSELQISRGNANINIRSLLEWGLVYKEVRQGERKEYFVAEKDIWNVFKQILIHRKKKELEPIIKTLDELSSVESNCVESIEFVKIVSDIKIFSCKADSTLDTLAKTDSNWFLGAFMKL